MPPKPKIVGGKVVGKMGFKEEKPKEGIVIKEETMFRVDKDGKAIPEKLPIFIYDRTLDRELIAISRTGMYFGKLFVHSTIAFLQCFCIYIVGFILFPVKSYALSPLLVLLLFFLLALFGLSLGLTVSIFSKHKETAVQIAPYLILGLFVTSLILIFPGASISQGTKVVVMNNPVALISQSLNEVILNGVGFEDISSSVIKMVIWIAGLITISLLKFRFEK